MKYWEIIADNLSRAAWSYGYRKEAQEISASDEQLYDFLEANGGSVLPNVWDLSSKATCPRVICPFS